MCQKIFVLLLTFSTSINIFLTCQPGVCRVWCPETGLLTFLKPPHLFGQGQNQTVPEDGKIEGFGKPLATFLGCGKICFSKRRDGVDYRCESPSGDNSGCHNGEGEGEGQG